MSDATAVSAADVKELRERTGAPIMDCKAALAEAGGDTEKAIEILRVRGQASAAKRSGRATSEGVVASYIHATGKVGVLGRGPVRDRLRRPQRRLPGIRARGRDPHRRRPLAARYVSAEEIPDEARDAERSVFEAKAREEGKPDEVIAKIVDGQLAKWAKEVALLEQEHVRSDRYEGRTIEDLRAELASKTGENVRIARFARFEVGQE